ncbi:hypothetical protein UREG_03461 [Uncinocarpus reesii 1704]|uniref:Protein HIR1 n=1 Tax=Uncinocarpus reesii (strain UAMH 1704) TaxID=336963 RepID=C4JQX9_UNCRE|nr:uncharacterized protein UREG_03461 [Uncinocarpus reesii 1704]EEP78615.1 hypothetical protein UREG_03461 [Uncinocarpus reesii 1704]
MEVAARSVLSRRLLVSQGQQSWRPSVSLVATMLPTENPSFCKRNFTSSRTLRADNSFLNLSSSAGGSSVPPTYFSNRQSLPANTIIRFVPQQTAWIVERMGKFHRILEPGLAILIPFIDRIAYVKSLKEAAIEIPSQNAITADNVTLELDGVLYTRVFDAYKASYGVEDAEYAISQLAQTTMRSEIGQLTLDHVLKERANLNANISQAINEAAQDWGVVCLRYEIRDIHAPEGVVEAMHRQVTAERSKRAEILESEGQRQSAINIAEGRKQSNAQAAVSLSVAEKYVDAFGKLAREGTAVVVPGNVGDMGGMIASALAVYGKVNEGQAKAIAAKAILPQETGQKDAQSRRTDLNRHQEEAVQRAQQPDSSVAQNEVAESVLESFEKTSHRRQSLFRERRDLYGIINIAIPTRGPRQIGRFAGFLNCNLLCDAQRLFAFPLLTRFRYPPLRRSNHALPCEKKDYEVYSCDISPDGKRLVTAAGDGHVRIWSTDAIYNAADPEYADKPKQLASLSNHSGTIHTVRFSPNGKYLASGADDKIVCVYVHEPNAPSHTSTFGTNEPPPVENWRTIRRLIGHDNDVQDLGWSFDSSILVSVGLDSKIVVWSGHTFEKLKTILSHQSHVKGITFDPANKYFATASDDRTIRIFRFTSPTPNSTAHDQIQNFVLEHTVKAPFVNSPLTTYFRRCSWSPDGNHIAAANAVNGPVNAAAIINRGSWDSDINLIGHEAAIEVCAFSPRLYSLTPPVKGAVDNQGHPALSLVTVIACAGGDKSLSVWITSNPRPIVITQDLSAKAISDLSWSPDGRSLFATALDGTILAVRFEDNELGYPMPIEENEKSLTKFGTNRRGAGIVESTDGLLLEERSKAGEIKGVEGRMGALMGDNHASTEQGVNGTSGDLTKNGTTSVGTATPTGAQKPQQNGASNGTPGEQEKPDPYAAKLERLKQRPTYTKDGKKRIAPLLVSGAGATQSSLPQSRLVATSAGAQVGRAEGPETILDLSKPFDGLPKGGLAALLFGNKRKFAQIEDNEENSVEKRVAAASHNGSIPILANGPDGLVPATPAPDSLQQTPEFIRPAVVNPVMSVSQLRLAVPKVRSHILQGNDSFGNPTEITAGAGASHQSKADTIFEARNPSSASLTGRMADREPARISLTRGDQPLWQDFLPKAVLLVTGNKKFWAAATEDGSVYIWTPAGRRLVNALVLEAQPVILECKESWLLCITAVGICYVWNVSTLASPHPPVSLASVLDAALHTMTPHPTTAPSIIAARISSQGRVIVALSNGDGYSYNPSLYTWQRLSEPWFAVASQYWNTTDSSVGDLQLASDQTGQNSKVPVSAGIIPFLERNTTHEILTRGRGYFLQRLIKILLSKEGFESFEAGASIAHLENRVAAALSLGAKEEFRLYLSMYAKRLGAEGLKLKTEELLEGLLGGIFSDCEKEKPEGSNEGPWESESDNLCGWPRRELLKEVVLALGPFALMTPPLLKPAGYTDS